LPRADHDALRDRRAYTLARHYPEQVDSENPALALLDAVTAGQAGLIARWQVLGFIHGVMNTDNMLLCGETVDYGPCAFMEAFDPATVFSSIDVQGRYAYRNQPGIAHWNLTRLAEALLPLIDSDSERAIEAKGVLDPALSRRLWRCAQRRYRRQAGSCATGRRRGPGAGRGAVYGTEGRRCRLHPGLPLPRRRSISGGAGSGAGALLRPRRSTPGVAAALEAAPGARGQYGRRASAAHVRLKPRVHRAQPPGTALQSTEGRRRRLRAVFHRLVERLANPHDYDGIGPRPGSARPNRSASACCAPFCGT
jgi:hypothetical protein